MTPRHRPTRSPHEHRRIVLTLDRLEDLALEVAEADAEDDAAYRRARRMLWRTFRAEVEAWAARPVNRRRAAG